MKITKFNACQLRIKLDIPTGLDCVCGHNPIIKTDQNRTGYMLECQECGCHTGMFSTLVECFEDWKNLYGDEASERKALAEKIVSDAIEQDCSMEEAFWMADLVCGECKEMDEENFDTWSCIDLISDWYFNGEHSVDIVDGMAYVIW